MGDDFDELLKMLVAASHDERLSTGSLYTGAASAIESLQRGLAKALGVVPEDVRAALDEARKDAGRLRYILSMSSIRIVRYNTLNDDEEYLCVADIDAEIAALAASPVAGEKA